MLSAAMRNAVEHPEGLSGKLVIANFTLGVNISKICSPRDDGKTKMLKEAVPSIEELIAVHLIGQAGLRLSSGMYAIRIMFRT